MTTTPAAAVAVARGAGHRRLHHGTARPYRGRDALAAVVPAQQTSDFSNALVLGTGKHRFRWAPFAIGDGDTPAASDAVEAASRCRNHREDRDPTAPEAITRRDW